MEMNRIPNLALARLIVGTLLEDAAVNVVCAGCQQEFGVQPPPNASHGYCKRHMLEMYDDSLQMAKRAMGTNPKAADRVRQLLSTMRDIKTRDEGTFAPDLSHQHHLRQPQQPPQQGQDQQQFQRAGVAQ
jgi:hypothetical protein